MKIYYPILIVFCITGFSACVPVNSSFESARMLDKGQLELKGNYSHYLYTESRSTEISNNNFGAGIGIGISQKWNVKTNYEFMRLPSDPDPIHYICIAPKYSIIPNIFASELPVSIYAGNDLNGPTWVVSPKLIGTYPFNNMFELSISVKADIFFEEDADIPIGINLGAGISPDLADWSLRPEAGIMFNTEGSGVATFIGIGATYNLNTRKQQVMITPRY